MEGKGCGKVGSNIQIKKGLYGGEGEKPGKLEPCLLPFLGRAGEAAACWSAGEHAACLPLRGLGGGEGCHHGQLQVKEQSSHIAVCPLVWVWPGIGPLDQHPGKGIDLYLTLS